VKFQFALSIAIALSAVAAHATGIPQERANQDVVAGYYAGLDQVDALEAQGKARVDFVQKLCDRYIAPGYIQHSAMMKNGNGRVALVQMLAGQAKMKPPPGLAAGEQLPPSKLLAFAADGNYVIRVNAQTIHGRTTLVWNMFRLENGLIAEHWDSISGTAMAPGAGSSGSPPGAAPPGGLASPPARAPGG